LRHITDLSLFTRRGAVRRWLHRLRQRTLAYREYGRWCDDGARCPPKLPPVPTDDDADALERDDLFWKDASTWMRQHGACARAATARSWVVRINPLQDNGGDPI